MRVNGKYFTIGFAVFICIFFAIVWSIFERHEVLGELLKKERSMWPKTAQALNRYFESRETEMSSSESNLKSDWTAARTEFAKSTIYDSQAKPALKLLQILQTHYSTKQEPAKFEFDSQENQTLQGFVEVDRLRHSTQSDLLGSVTYGILFLNYPPPIHTELAKILATPKAVSQSDVQRTRMVAHHSGQIAFR